MAPHSNIHAWRIPWTEEPGQLYIVHGAAELDTTAWPTQVLLKRQRGLKPYTVRASLVARSVKNPPTIQETWVRPLGWESMEEGTATHSSILAWNPHGQRGLAGCNLWGHRESDVTSTAVLVLFVLHIVCSKEREEFSKSTDCKFRLWKQWMVKEPRKAWMPKQMSGIKPETAFLTRDVEYWLVPQIHLWGPLHHSK